MSLYSAADQAVLPFTACTRLLRSCSVGVFPERKLRKRQQRHIGISIYNKKPGCLAQSYTLLALLEGAKVSPGGFFQGSCKEREPDQSAKLRRWPVDSPKTDSQSLGIGARAARESGAGMSRHECAILLASAGDLC